MTLRAKRIVPIRVSPTCVGTVLTSSSSLGRASDGSRSGGSLHCGRKTPQKGIGQIPPVGKGTGPPRLEDVYVRRRPVEFTAVSFFPGDPALSSLLDMRRASPRDFPTSCRL